MHLNPLIPRLIRIIFEKGPTAVLPFFEAATQCGLSAISRCSKQYSSFHLRTYRSYIYVFCILFFIIFLYLMSVCLFAPKRQGEIPRMGKKPTLQ